MNVPDSEKEKEKSPFEMRRKKKKKLDNKKTRGVSEMKGVKCYIIYAWRMVYTVEKNIK